MPVVRIELFMEDLMSAALIRMGRESGRNKINAEARRLKEQRITAVRAALDDYQCRAGDPRHRVAAISRVTGIPARSVRRYLATL